MRTVRSLAALAVVLAVAVSGCTDTTRPKPLPSASPSPTSSVSATPAPPTMPPEASGTSPAAAKAFARFYINLVNYSSRTGSTEMLDQFGKSECQSCAAISRNINDVYSAGGDIKTEGWVLQSVAVVPLQPKQRPILDLGVLQSPEEVRQSSQGPKKKFKGGKQPMTMYLSHDGRAWRVQRLDLVS